MSNEALASPVQEPVAVVGSGFQLLWTGGSSFADHANKHGIKVGSLLYTAPPTRQFVGLTDEEHEEAVEVCLHVGVEGLVFWLEDKLKEKNQ